MTTTQNNTLASIEQYLDTVQKQAESYTEPGSIGGSTTHPVKDEDDCTEAASEGERSSENSKDVKKDQGEAAVDNAPEATAKVGEANKKAMTEGTAAEDQLQIGTEKKPTGKDPSNETSSAKGGKEDGGYEGPSSHPARTDNDSLDGHKYAEEELRKMPLDKLAAYVGDRGNDICATIAMQIKQAGEADFNVPSKKPNPAAPQGTNKQASANQPTQTHPKNSVADSINPKLAEQVGWEMAAIIENKIDKQAADAMVVNTIAEIIKTAEDRADRVAKYIQKYAEQKKKAGQTKRAMGEEGGEMPPAPAYESGNDEGGNDEGGGGEAPPAAYAGAEAAGPPSAEPPMGGEGGGEGMISIEELIPLLEALGIGPEQLQGLAGGGGAEPPMGGGEPPMGGGGEPPMPPMDPAMGGGAPPVPGGGMEVAASDKSKGKGKAPSAEKMAGYVREALSRCRK